jgi:hypothetical protein
MAALTSLQGRGGGRIPLASGSVLSLSRQQLAEVVEQLAQDIYPHLGHSAALRALHANPNAANLFCEAAAAYCAAPVPAPAPMPATRRHTTARSK